MVRPSRRHGFPYGFIIEIMGVFVNLPMEVPYAMMFGFGEQGEEVEGKLATF